MEGGCFYAVVLVCLRCSWTCILAKTCETGAGVFTLAAELAAAVAKLLELLWVHVQAGGDWSCWIIEIC